MLAGREDIDRAAQALASRLPWKLAPLARVAYNYRWSWMEDGASIFREVDERSWRMCGNNPVRLLQEAAAESLLSAAADKELVRRAEAVEARIRDDLARPFAEQPDADEERPIAYFSAEFGIHASLPIYSGGLGALAGDVLKESSDRAVPMVGVGLMYRRGYFRQRIDGTGWQQEYWVSTDPERCPAVLVSDEEGAPLTVTVPVGEADVIAQIWRVDVGRVPLFLLDTEVPENDRMSRWITSRLYDGDPDTRLAQYVLLGIGGMKALRAMDIDPGVVHMNEGHAAFTAVEMTREAIAGGTSLDDALAAGRDRTVFTTHTPVPAGNDTYPPERIAAALRRSFEECGTDAGTFIRLGRTNPDDEHEPFGVTQFALRNSRAANGVSRRHGFVSREMWQGLWPDREQDKVPITHVTNGVHMPSWVGAPMRHLLDRHLGEAWAERVLEPGALDAIDAIPDEELWAVRCSQREWLVDFVRDRSMLERLARGEARHYAEAAANSFDKDALTIGFARRLATYKRLHLLLRDPGRSLNLLAGDRPIQFVMAGKAHPKDDEGKKLVQNLFAFRGEDAVSRKVVYVEDYDMDVAARLVRGCDVWINVPRPPLEASGTSGMKNVVNGGLQLSVLDGWWAEGFDGSNGWGLNGDVDHDHESQDHRDAGELYRVLEGEVMREFYERDDQGIPRAWVRRVKNSMKTLVGEFSAARMIRDYEQEIWPASSLAGRR